MDDTAAIKLLEQRIAQLEDLIAGLRIGCTKTSAERVDHQEIYATLALTMRVAIPAGSGVEQFGSSAGS